MREDRGSEFKNELFLELSKIVAFHIFRTTAHHPYSNRLIEREYMKIKTAIVTHKKSWFTMLPHEHVIIHSTVEQNESGSLFICDLTAL